ncbi:MAG: TetR/AcrR family transcriptional regulator [Clostridiales bacterium]|nr:TetR/AcrR family transcriptional regulator [Clostridiales bacterium]
MPKGSTALTNARREEIISACEQLYQTMSFKEITLKDIAGATSFTRTSIYNYFQTKEEIFLALMQKEYERWVEELDALCISYSAMSAEAFSGALAHSLEKRGMLLKLLSMNHFDMEENSRPECLVEFKKAYGASIEAVRRCLERFFPQMDARAQQDFLYAFLPFLYGLYPYTTVSEKQRLAMKEAGLDFVYLSVYDMAYGCIRALLK